MPKHKAQHFIPKCYQKAWADPDTPIGQDPYVWVHSKDGASSRKKAPVNLFIESEIYTVDLPSLGRSLHLEYGLQQIEDQFIRVKREILDHERPLDSEDHLWLSIFVATMYSRTPAFREQQRAMWARPLEVMREMKKAVDTAKPDDRARIISQLSSIGPSENSMSMSEIEEVVEDPLIKMMPATISVLVPLLIPLDLAVFTTDDELGFITSDSPCVWFDPEWYKNPPIYQAPSLSCPKIEITLPVSPHQCLCMNRQGLSGYTRLPDDSMLDELNRRTRFRCDEHFITRRMHLKETWFDQGVEPDDSWRKIKERERKDRSG